MKKSNYYSIHKNKKKRKSTKTDFQKAWGKTLPIILRAMKLVQQAIEQSQIRIPKYRTGGIPAGLLSDTVHEIVINDSASRAGSNPERLIHSILSQPKNGSEIVFNSSNESKNWVNPYLTDEYKKHLLSVPPMEYENLVLGSWKPENDLNEKGERYFIDDGKNLKEQIQRPFSFDEITEINPEVLKTLNKRNSFEM